MDNPSAWYLHWGIGLLAFLLTVTGTSLAIVFIPTAFTLSILIFILIVGPGVFICYKRNSFWILLAAFGSVTFGYNFFAGPIGSAVCYAFQDDFVPKVLPTVCLAALPSGFLAAFFGRRKTYRYATRKKILFIAFAAYLICLVITGAFVFAAMLDYNYRADTSLPEVIRMEIVRKEWDSDGGNMLWIKALDRELRFFDTFVPNDIYVKCEVGSVVDVKVRSGALGYAWLEEYQLTEAQQRNETS